jgi:hypothetical protein
VKLSEVPLMTPVLCKQTNTIWSDIFEVVLLGYSTNKKAVYMQIASGGPGRASTCVPSWRDFTELDDKWVVFDTIGTHQ